MKVYFYELGGGLVVSSTNHPIKFSRTNQSNKVVLNPESKIKVIRNGKVINVTKESLYFKSTSIILSYVVETEQTSFITIKEESVPKQTAFNFPVQKVNDAGFINGDHRLPTYTNNWSHIGDNPNETFVFGHHKGKSFDSPEFSMNTSSTDVAYYCGIKLLNNVYRRLHGLSTLNTTEEMEIKASLVDSRVPIKLSEKFRTGKFQCK